MVHYCPLCMYPLPSDHSKKCINCGFDSSCNYESYPTLVPIPEGVTSLLTRRTQIDQKQREVLQKLMDKFDRLKIEVEQQKEANEKLRAESKNLKVENRKLKDKNECLEKRIQSCQEMEMALTAQIADIEDKLKNVHAIQAVDHGKTEIVVGTRVTYGKYPEPIGGVSIPITWIVLEVKDEDVKLITEEIPTSKSFRFVGLSKSWKLSNPKRWLEEEFYLKAFDQREREGISDTPHTGKIHILTYDEVKMYFKTPEGAVAYPTDYSERRDGYFKPGRLPCSWWLRTGDYVDQFGDFKYATREELDINRGIRPVMWVKKDRLL